MNSKAAILVLGLFAGVTAAGPTTAPATQPSAEMKARVEKLIAQLGDPLFPVRQSATDELRQIGKSAVPQLAEAKKNSDPEIAARAESVLKDIDEQSRPKVQADPNVTRLPLRGGARAQIRLHAGGGGGGGIQIVQQRNIQVSENGRTVSIKEENGAITVTLTEKKDGKDVTQEWKAGSLEELKKNHPEAAKLYKQHMGEAEQIQIEVQGQ